VFISALADGAGSAAFAVEGAEAATDNFIDCVTAALQTAKVAELTPDLAHLWLEEAQKSVLSTAAAAARPVVEYASTFLAAVVGDGAALFMQIGDGLIVFQLAASAGWDLVFQPQHGEYINQTSFLTNENALLQAAVRRVEGRLTKIALTSDGLEAVCLDRSTGTPFAPFFDALMSTVIDASDDESQQLSQGLARYLASGDVNTHTHDDKALVLATRWPAE
jgi:hypothetical protein